MNNILKIALTLAVGIVLAGCYNDFDNPAPAKVYTDKDFTETGAEIISIKDLKAKFYEKWGHDANGLGRRVVIEDDVVIKGKVISSDAEGNVYKSLYIYDGEQAIELRLMNDNYVNYPLGQIVYVKAQGLSLASYRYMLSLGAAPALEPDGTFPNDTPSEHDFSASGNSNIPTTEMVQQYVYRGELDTITEADVTVVDKDNYKTVLNDDLLGCLIRFEGLRSSYTTVDSNTYPNYLENVNGVYTNKYYQDEGLPITWAYNYDNTKYYGSSLFTYETTPTSLESGSYVVRVSGYARFALKELPADNAMVNITAIYTKYSSRTGRVHHLPAARQQLQGHRGTVTPDVRCQPNRKLSSFRFFRFSAEKTVHPHRFLTISTVFEAFDKKKVEIRSERNDFFSNFAIVYNTLISTHMTTNNYKTPFQQGGGNYEAPELTIATVSIEKGFAATEPNSNAPLEDESYE